MCEEPKPSEKGIRTKDHKILTFFFSLIIDVFLVRKVTAYTAADQCCSQGVNAPSLWETFNGTESPPAIWQGMMRLSLGKGPLLTTRSTHAEVHEQLGLGQRF